MRHQDYLRVGFTGSREGVSMHQRVALLRWIADNAHKVVEWHHGCCVGADTTGAFFAAREIPMFLLIAHPPTNAAMLSGDALKKSWAVMPAADYIQRNHNIVDACNVLLAFPKEDAEVMRSGTWATFRYAKKQGKRTVVFYPNGTVVESRPMTNPPASSC